MKLRELVEVYAVAPIEIANDLENANQLTVSVVSTHSSQTRRYV